MADCVDPKLMELIARNVVFKLINEHTLQSGLRSCDSTCTWLSHESRVATCDQLDAAIAGVDIGDTIEGFTYDPDTGLLTIDTDQGNFYVTLPIPEANTDTYPVSLVLGADYVLSLTLNNGTILTTSFQPLADMVQAFTDRFLRMVGYNASTHTMTFEIGNDSGSGVQTFTINLSDLIPITVAADVCLDGDGTEASPLSLDIDCLAQRIVELAPSMALHLGDGCGLTGSGTAADPLCIDPDVIARRDALGTAAYLDVPVSGDAGPTEVVLGNDSRLSDARTPLAHQHPITVGTPSSSSGTLTLDFAGKSRAVFATTLTENVTTVTISNLPSSVYLEYEIHYAQDGTGSRTVAQPASHKALGGSDTAVASAANAVTVLSASSVDGGTTWRYAMQESA